VGLFNFFKKKNVEDNNKIDVITDKLFSIKYDSEDDSLDEEYNDIVKQQLKRYGYEKVLKSWFKFLFDKCKTKQTISNFANLLWCYICELDRSNKQWKNIPNSYKVVAYLWYNINEEDALLDGITDVLLSPKIKNFNITNFNPNEDKIIKQYFDEFNKECK